MDAKSARNHQRLQGEPKRGARELKWRTNGAIFYQKRDAFRLLKSYRREGRNINPVNWFVRPFFPLHSLREVKYRMLSNAMPLGSYSKPIGTRQEKLGERCIERVKEIWRCAISTPILANRHTIVSNPQFVNIPGNWKVRESSTVHITPVGLILTDKA